MDGSRLLRCTPPVQATAMDQYIEGISRCIAELDSSVTKIVDTDHGIDERRREIDLLKEENTKARDCSSIQICLLYNTMTLDTSEKAREEVQKLRQRVKPDTAELLDKLCDGNPQQAREMYEAAVDWAARNLKQSASGSYCSKIRISLFAQRVCMKKGVRPEAIPTSGKALYELCKALKPEHACGYDQLDKPPLPIADKLVPMLEDYWEKAVGQDLHHQHQAAFG